MSKGNGKMIDEGLAAIKLAFKDAKFLDADGKECANLMMLGAHRTVEIPDNLIMDMYGSITSGRNVELSFESNEGNGYTAQLTSYGDLIKLMQGTLEAAVVEAGNG